MSSSAPPPLAFRRPSDSLSFRSGFHWDLHSEIQFDRKAVILHIVNMTSTIQISSRGTMTLPKPLRKTLGVDKGGIVMAEVTDEGIVLHPATAFPIELYSDDRIAEFDAEDAALAERLGNTQR